MHNFKSAIAIATTLALVGPAFAADLPARKYAPAAILTPTPAYSWDGFYAGLSLGYAWENLDSRIGLGVGSNNFTPNGAVGGLYLGRNWQFSPSLVIGLDSSIEGAAVKQSRNLALGAGIGAFGGTLTVSNNFRMATRARVGLAMDRALLYVAGGVSMANFNATANWGGAFAESWSTTRTGWTIGTGLDYAFTLNWIGRVEYRYSSFGNFTRWSPFAGQLTQRINDHAVRAGIAYKFGG